jgi:hypothetical protein
MYNSFTELEKIYRRKAEEFLDSLKIPLQILALPEKESYSKAECVLCNHYGYFSYIKCGLCNKKRCLYHDPEEKLRLCTCKKPLVLLCYRDISKK